MEMPFLCLGLLVGTVIGMLVGGYMIGDAYKQEAYQRGHMVECLGKSGYYWECE